MAAAAVALAMIKARGTNDGGRVVARGERERGGGDDGIHTVGLYASANAGCFITV